MKGKYIALIVAGGLMVGGIGIGAAALATSAFNIENMTTEEEQMEETFNISESFKNIRVESDSCNVEYHHATDGKTRVDISVPKGFEYTAGVDNDTLKVTVRDERTWNLMIFSFSNPKVDVYLPGNEYADFYTEGNSGNAVVENGFLFDTAYVSQTSGNIKFSSDVKGNLDLSAKSGNVNCEDVNASNTRIEATSGNIKVTNLNTSELNAKNTSGNIIFNNIKAENVKIDGNSGNTSVEKAQIAKNLTSTRTSGGTKFDDVVVGGELNAKTSSGNIHLTGCDAAVLELNASSGIISAELLTNKEITAHSSSGIVTLPGDDAGEKNGTLHAETSSGNIKIKVK